MATTDETDVKLMTREQWKNLLSTVVNADFERPLRRKFRRYAVDGEVRAVGEIGDVYYKKTWPLIEASINGLTAKAESPAPTGAECMVYVNVTGTPMPVKGTIVHCTQTLGGYKIGIRMEFEE